MSVVTRVRGHSSVLIQWLIKADGFRESSTNYSEQGSILSTAPCTEFRLNEGFVSFLPHKQLSITGIHDPYVFLAHCDRSDH